MPSYHLSKYSLKLMLLLFDIESIFLRFNVLLFIGKMRAKEDGGILTQI